MLVQSEYLLPTISDLIQSIVGLDLHGLSVYAHGLIIKGDYYYNYAIWTFQSQVLPHGVKPATDIF